MRTNDLIRYLICPLLAVLAIGQDITAAPVLSVVASSSFGAGSTTQLQLQIEGDPALTTQVLGWQASLMIEPQSGSTGRVFFSGASIPSQDYLLGVNGQGLSGVPTSPEIQITLFDADTSNPLEGGIIGVGEILRLADIEIDSTSDATGEFEISIIDQGPIAPSTRSYRTQWTNGAIEDVQFGNAARNSNPVSLATISVTAVPEPSSFTFLLILASTIGYRYWIQHRLE